MGKNNSIKVTFLKDHEKYKKGDIEEISRPLFMNSLKNKGIAVETTKKHEDELNKRKIIEMENQKELEKKEAEEANKMKENEKRQNEIRKEYEEKQKQKMEELKNISVVELYKRYPKYNSGNELNSDYFKDLSKDLVLKFKSENLTSTKLREYYNSINNLYYSHNSEDNLKIELYLLLAKVNYDYSRIKSINNRFFIDFLEKNISDLFDGDFEIKSFTIFKKHFETVVAYSKGILIEN